MSPNDHFPCNYNQACHVLWCVEILQWSQTKTAIALGLNVGTVCKVVHGKRHPTAVPIQPPEFKDAA